MLEIMKIAIRQSQKLNSRIHNSRIAIRQRIAQLGLKEGTTKGNPLKEGTTKGNPLKEGTTKGNPLKEGTTKGNPQKEGTTKGNPLK